MKGLTRKEELILLAVLALRDEAYLVAITDYLAEVVGEAMTLPWVHIPLSRLEKAGLVAAEMGEATAVRGGRRKKIYRLTAAGEQALAEYRRISDRLWAESARQTNSTGE